jgi:hypothetical protein
MIRQTEPESEWGKETKEMVGYRRQKQAQT